MNEEELKRLSVLSGLLDPACLELIRGKIKTDDKGQFVGVREALTELRASNPHLFAKHASKMTAIEYASARDSAIFSETDLSTPTSERHASTLSREDYERAKSRATS